MSRLDNAILQANTSFNVGLNAPMVDLQNGAENGYAPDLIGWVSNAAYVRTHVICLLCEAPTGFNYLPNPASWIGTLRALVELQALSIDGLQAGLEATFNETPIGGAGQVQHDVTDVKETVSKVTFRWAEKYGMPVFNFIRNWMTWLMMDPNTKYPNVVTLLDKPTDMLPDVSTATMIFIEPDPTHTKVMRAWLMANMMPEQTGESAGHRDLTQAREAPSYDIPFTGFTQYGAGVNQFAQTLLNGINLNGANPQMRAAFVQNIQANITATPSGYGNEAASVAVNAVTV